jgi:hypothetical protein
VIDTIALDDEVEGGVLESIDSALREQHVVEHCEPLAGVAIAGDDHRRASCALEEELIDVATLLFTHRLEGEVVEEGKATDVSAIISASRELSSRLCRRRRSISSARMKVTLVAVP